jgi:sulfur-carrier protein
VAALQSRGGAWAEELAAGRAFRVAVNQDIVALDSPLSDGAEVAIFPPVTGG